MKKCMILFVIAAAFSVPAETWYIDAAAAKAHATAKSKPFDVPSVWTNAAGDTASALLATDTLVVPDGVQLNYSGSMTAPAPLHLGVAGGGALAILHCSSGNLTADIYWHNGRIQTQQYRASYGVTGTITVDGSEMGASHIWCYNKVQSTSTYNMSWNIWSQLIGNAQQAIQFLYAPGTIKSEPVPIQQLPVVGNNVQWQGQFVVSAYANLILGHANAAGSAETVRADAIVLGDHARLAVPVGVTPNAARGINITGSDVRFQARTYPHGFTDCTDYALNMPIAGTNGFTKTGAGRVVLGGVYTAGAIVVEEGTLEIVATATVTNGTQILVKNGARLITHISLAQVDVTVEEGGVFERVIDPFVVAFDSENVTTTPCVLSNEIVELEQIVPFRLSESIPLPQHAAHKLAIFTYDGAETLMPPMFADTTPKTYGLPKGEITIESASGIQTVYLNTRPVVVSRAKIEYASTNNINGSAETWSDGQTVHSNADYLLTHGYDSYHGSANVAFAGDSLTLSETSFVSKASMNLFETASGNPLVFYPPFSSVQAHSGGRRHVYAGKIFLAGTYDSEDAFTLETTYQDPARRTGTTTGSAELRADLTGEGVLFITARRLAGLNRLTGDNSGYRGRILIQGNINDSDDGLFIEFGVAENLGGPLDAFHADALTLDQHAFLYPTTNVTLAADVCRGMTVKDAGVLCPETTTLTTCWPLRLTGEFCKQGAGTLRLGGEISYGADGTGTNGTMRVTDGTLSILSDAAVSGLAITFSNDVRLAVGPSLLRGLTVVPTVQDAVDGSAGHIRLAIDAAAIPELWSGRIETVVATLPSGSADLTTMFGVPEHLRRYGVPDLVKRTVQIGDVTYDQYVLTASCQKTVIIIR